MARGNLGFSARKILTSVIATYANICSSARSSKPRGSPSQRCRMLPYRSELPRSPRFRWDA